MKPAEYNNNKLIIYDRVLMDLFIRNNGLNLNDAFYTNNLNFEVKIDMIKHKISNWDIKIKSKDNPDNSVLSLLKDAINISIAKENDIFYGYCDFDKRYDIMLLNNKKYSNKRGSKTIIEFDLNYIIVDINLFDSGFDFYNIW